MFSPTRWIAALILCALITACAPMFTDRLLADRTQFFDPALVGEWDAGSDGHVVIAHNGDGYTLSDPAKHGSEIYDALAARARGQTFLLVQERGKEQAVAADLPNTRLFYLVRYSIDRDKLTMALPTDERIEAMEVSGALPAPVTRYCDPNGGYNGPPAAPTSPSCAVFDVTLAQVALPDGQGLFDGKQITVLTRVR